VSARPPAATDPASATDPVARVLSDLVAICEGGLTLLAVDGHAAHSPDLLRALAELRAETLAAFAFLGDADD